MDSSLKEFSARADSLFVGLPTSNFALRLGCVGDKEDTEIAEEEPEPSLMTWKEASSVSRDPEKVLPREPSTAARKAFEEELEYDEFDLLATETMESEYQRNEKFSLNPEVLDDDDDDANDDNGGTRIVSKRSGVPRYLRYPEKYKCYTLDEPISVSYATQNASPVRNESISESPKQIVFRKTDEARNSIQKMAVDVPDSLSTSSVKTEALESFNETDPKQESHSNDGEDSSHKTSSRSSRNYRKKSNRTVF
eukprot:g6019.t1